ncbi:hypothetical protein HG535_0C05460 [Zygotorulaspora mrakii]|uniref:CWH43-like N-terminal domain-containing protein n=1 Tax=Zygotorulaspora mrakii TaxID=42260 RepID=A0A7H9B362_ZYGMR|nr:uncharacterized protein HG535_0C05460 [Zygotorulaspora mrakii]QLG72192.1 hypothetical protein HG535_0C05460 [Zygotorulaspora mrakii]
MSRKPGNYFFLLPIIAFVPWYGMLIAMLACWAGQGHPIYWFMNPGQFPVYISDIGATNLNPLFISCAAWQGLFYVITVACEFYQRAGYWPFHARPRDEVPQDDTSFKSMKTQYSELLLSAKFLMPPWYSKDERNLIFASFVLGVIGELGLLFCSIFTTAKYHDVHMSMVVVFVVFMCLSIWCNIIEYFMMGRHYALLHPLAFTDNDRLTIDDIKWYQIKGHVWNKFIISALVKFVWLVLAIVWAICFGAIEDSSISACFEWLLAFWFGVYFTNLSVDFYLGGRYKKSRYFHQVESFAGYYKYENLVNSQQQHATEETVSIADSQTPLGGYMPN